MKFQSIIIIEDITNTDDVNHILKFLLRSQIIKNNFDFKTSLIEVVTKEEGKISIGIKDLAQKLEFLSKKIGQDQLKILIINDSHLLTEEAQNSILKIVEEPYEQSLIVLRCQNISYLLETIVSRCRIEYLDKKPRNQNHIIDCLLDLNFFQRGKYLEELTEKFSRYELKLIFSQAFARILLTNNYYSREILFNEDFKDEIINLLISVDSGINMKIIMNNINVKIKKLTGN